MEIPKPCPFCGARVQALIDSIFGVSYVHITCPTCEVKMEATGTTDKENATFLRNAKKALIIKWNKRYETPSTQ